jgi:hypothetical protein
VGNGDAAVCWDARGMCQVCPEVFGVISLGFAALFIFVGVGSSAIGMMRPAVCSGEEPPTRWIREPRPHVLESVRSAGHVPGGGSGSCW